MKYGRASRAISITLPEDVITRLGSVDADLGSAIVALAERTRPPRVRALRTAELAAYGNHAVIIVNPTKALKKLPGVQLVPLGSGRALISLEDGKSIPQLELALRDAIESSGLRAAERQTLTAIADILRQARRSRTVRLEARTIIVLESKRQHRRT